MDLTELLGEAKKLNASDLHITVGVPPQVRVNGALIVMENCPRLMGMIRRSLLKVSWENGRKACLKIRGRWISPLESRHWAGSGLMPSARGEQLQQHSVW